MSVLQRKGKGGYSGLKKWFILNGNQGSGKDAFKTALSKYAKVKSISTVDIPKEIAKSLGWDGVKRDNDRNMLSDLKDWWTKYFDGSFKYVERELNNFLYGEKDSDVEIFTVDSREPEEIERLVRVLCFETILIERDSANHTASNHADSNVHEYKNYDYVIYNNGTLEDLDNLAKTFVENIVKGEPNVDCGDVSDVESDYDYVIYDNGTLEDLDTLAKTFVESICKSQGDNIN